MSDFLRRARRHGSFMLGGMLSLLLLLMALLALVWTPYDPFKTNVRLRMRPPSLEYWLGTDSFGRDIASLLMAGAQNSILVGLIAVGIGLGAGTALGLLAAARRGWVEELVMRFSDFTLAFPAVLSAILLTAIFGPGSLNSIVAIGLFNIPVFARVSRAAGNAIWARGFVTAAQACGKGSSRITLEHVLPNILPLIVVQATIQFAIAILAEAALSYLGLGTQPPTPSWGRMLNEAQIYVFNRPWLAIYPGVCIAASVFGLNLLGDGLRDLIDPKLSRRR
jgi:peptide/nickel transport system permease protein